MLFNAWSFWWGSGAVTVLNVGQGQSVLVRSGGFLCLVDCGGDSYDNAGDIAADFLGDYGVGRLDLLVLTHFHADHANGVTELLKRVQLWWEKRGKVVGQIGAWPAASKTNASWPAHRLGRAGEVVY